MDRLIALGRLQILENVSEGYISITPEGQVIFANRIAKDIFSAIDHNYDYDALYLSTIFEDFDTREMTYAQFMRQMMEKDMEEHTFMLKTNAQIEVCFSYYPYDFQDDTLIAVQDSPIILRVSRRFELESQQNQLFINVFEALPLPQVVVDGTLQIIMVNQAFEEYFAVERENIIGLIFGEVIHCVNAEARGCGQMAECGICQFRQVVGRLVVTRRILKDYLVKLEVHRDKVMWLNINMVPMEKSYSLLTLQDMTDRINANKHIEDARRFGISLLEDLPTFVFQLDNHQKCQFVNHSMQRELGVVTKSLDTYFRDNMTEKFYSQFRDAIDEVYRKQKLVQLETVIGSIYGEQKTFFCLFKPILDIDGVMTGAICLMLDVNEDSILKHLYVQSKLKYEAIFKHLHMGIGYFEVAFDDAHHVVDMYLMEFNQSLSSLCEYQPPLFPKQKLQQLAIVDEKDLWWFYREVSEVVNTKNVKELEAYHSEALNKWIEITVYSPEKDYVSLLVKDVDEQHRLAIDLERAKENSEAANRSKSDFLANMSHEIRTPLNGIVGMIDLTLMDEVSEEQYDNLKTAKSCVNSLMTIINDVLDFSKIEAGEMKIQPAPFDLMLLVAEVIKSHMPHAKTKEIKLVAVYSEIFERILMGDEGRIKQILNNFLSNAIKFTHHGEVKMHISQKIIDNDYIALAVKVVDTGIGISDDKKDLLFKRFSQVDSSFTREYGGTGLGLVITKQLIDMMGGKLWFESKEGVGSTFAFNLPLPPAQVKKANLSMDNFVFPEDKKVLIVEDDVVNQLVISKMLENLGVNFEIAEHGKEAVARCERHTYDLILMDIQMPEMDGIQATQYIRNTNQNANVPIVALTAYALSGDEALFKASGMDDYLSKPIKLESLSKVMAFYLTRQRKETPQNTLAVPMDLSGYEHKQEAYEEVVFKNYAEDLLSKTNYLLHLFEEKNYLIIEVFAHQLKAYFSELQVEELKNLAFKMELDIRREQFDEAHHKLLRIREIIRVLSKEKTQEDTDD